MKSFRALYNAYIGPWPARTTEEVKEWWNVVSRVPNDKLRDFVSELRSLRDGNRKPLVPECWQALNAVMPRKSDYRADLPPREVCGLCNGSGFMWCVGRFEQIAGKTKFSPSCNPEKGPLTTAVVPCVCPIGDQRCDRHTDMALRSLIHQFREEVLPGEAVASGNVYEGTKEWLFTLDVIRESNGYAGRKSPTVEPEREIDTAVAMALETQERESELYEEEVEEL